MARLNRPQASLWAAPRTRAEIDMHRLAVGDRVWCAGRPFVVSHILQDGRAGVVYDSRAHPPPQKNGTSR